MTRKPRRSPNLWLAQKITDSVGTMWAAYLFVALAAVSLPAAIHSRDAIVIVAWIAQTFLQLVLLPVIMVGQSMAGARTERVIYDTHSEVSEALSAVQAVAATQQALLLEHHGLLKDVHVIAADAHRLTAATHARVTAAAPQPPRPRKETPRKAVPAVAEPAKPEPAKRPAGRKAAPK